MNVIKRRLAILLLLALVLTACGKQPSMIQCDQSTHSSNSVELTIAIVSDPSSRTLGFDLISRAVASFNKNSQKYHVSISYYPKDGNDIETGLRQLNTEIISGKYPDMICFSQISPGPFISKGILLDMDEMLSRDPLLSSGDITAIQALRSLGGLYLLSNSITANTLIAQYSRFGDRLGWTLKEYLDIESSVSPDTWVIYNITHEQFLKRVAQHYIETAIDWENNKCCFDCEEFYGILEASKRIQNKPATADNMLIGFGGTLVAEGKLISAISMTDRVFAFAQNELDAGGRLSYIGWPTVDGRCGTDIALQQPIGIVSNSKHVDGCWEFLRYMITEMESDYGIPIYRPLLEAQIQDAITNEDSPVRMSEEQAERLYELLSNVEGLAFYDETAMKIIMKESEEFFANHRTAEETASIVQAKVSIYLSEIQ